MLVRETTFTPIQNTFIIIITIIITITITLSPITSLFSLVLLLNQRRSPPLRLRVADCSTFLTTCGAPSLAAFCSVYWMFTWCGFFFFKPFVTVLVAPIITGIINAIIIIFIIIMKGKAVPVHALKAYRDSRCTAAPIFSLSTSWRWVVNFAPRPFHLREEIPVPTEHEEGWALEHVGTFCRR